MTEGSSCCPRFDLLTNTSQQREFKRYVESLDQANPDFNSLFEKRRKVGDEDFLKYWFLKSQPLDLDEQESNFIYPTQPGTEKKCGRLSLTSVIQAPDQPIDKHPVDVNDDVINRLASAIVMSQPIPKDLVMRNALKKGKLPPSSIQKPPSPQRPAPLKSDGSKAAMPPSFRVSLSSSDMTQTPSHSSGQTRP